MITTPAHVDAAQRRWSVNQHFAAMNLWHLFASRATATPDAIFLTWEPFDAPSRSYSYGETLHLARSLGAGMQARGVDAGDGVLIHLDNCPEFLFAWLACAAVGAVAVTTNTRSPYDELAYYCDDAQVRYGITQPRHAELVAKAAPTLRWLVSTDNDSGVVAVDSQLPAPDDRFSALYGNPDDVRIAPPDPLAVAVLQYTSGTTARPKGVLWTHANTLWSARASASHEGLRGDDNHLVYTPLFHANATVHAVLPTIWVGGRLTLVPKWSTSRFWDISLRHQCSWTTLIGLSVRALLRQPAPSGHAYRMFGSGFSTESFPGVGVKTIGWWAMTETCTTAIVADPHLPNREGGCGRPAPEYGIAIRRDDGTLADPEETGHLLVRGIPGLSLFAGYHGQAEATSASFDDDGWFRTGDLVVAHSDGEITFVGRDKDMLKVGAENVAAVEIERVISAVPGIVEVAVVPRPDEKLDEVPVAFVVAPGASPDLEALVVEACAQVLADFKVPRAVYRIAELPRSTINKVNKVALREVSAPDADRNAAERRWVEAARVDPSGEAM